MSWRIVWAMFWMILITSRVVCSDEKKKSQNTWSNFALFWWKVSEFSSFKSTGAKFSLICYPLFVIDDIKNKKQNLYHNDFHDTRSELHIKCTCTVKRALMRGPLLVAGQLFEGLFLVGAPKNFDRFVIVVNTGAYWLYSIPKKNPMPNYNSTDLPKSWKGHSVSNQPHVPRWPPRILTKLGQNDPMYPKRTNTKK